MPDPGTIHDMQVMNQRFILFRRAGVFYCEDTSTGKQLSLRTRDEGEAKTLLHARNEAFRQPLLNLHIARTYMAASDPLVSKRTWQSPMDEMTRTKTGPTRIRHERAMMDAAFDTIRNRPIVETNSGHFLDVLAAGTVSTNVFLRRIHNFALDPTFSPQNFCFSTTDLRSRPVTFIASRPSSRKGNAFNFGQSGSDASDFQPVARNSFKMPVFKTP